MPREESAIQRLLWRSKAHTKQGVESMVQRIRKTNISTESIGLSNVKKTQAWRYPGNQIIRAPTLKLDPLDASKNYFDPKDSGLPRRKQQSNFFITLNTNLSISDERGDIWMQALEKTLHRLSKQSEMVKYIKFGPKDNEYVDDKFSAVIQSLDWNAAVEVGPVLGRIHSHIWLTVDHYSQVQINVQALMYMSKMIFNEESGKLGGNNGRKGALSKQPYVHVKLLPQSNWTEVMRNYIHKAMKTPTL